MQNILLTSWTVLALNFIFVVLSGIMSVFWLISVEHLPVMQIEASVALLWGMFEKVSSETGLFICFTACELS